MAKHEDITPETCRKLIEYDPATGRLTWKMRDLRYFADERSHRSWNAKWPGKPAIAAECRRPGGQLVRLIGQLLDRPVKAHRVAWAIYYGEWPSGELDHINGNPADNRIENLRMVTRTENARNASMHADNRSGFAGVSWNKRTRKWTATLGINKRRKYLGEYDTPEAAWEARKKAQVELGFHPNHGRR